MTGSHWLVEADTYARLRAAASAEAAATAEQRAEFQAAARGVESSPLVVAGDVGEIKIEGLLTARPDFLAWLLGMGNTTYGSIVDALASAAADPAIKRVQLSINSPGGQVAGLFDALAALESFPKPLSTKASFAASAAYALAARGGPITATGPSATFGSIGVAASFRVDDNVIDITSSAAPNKRPDPRTTEGKAVIQGELDAVHALFAHEIARGRKTTVERVNSDFGKGGVLLAAQAKELGMIDAINGKPKRSTARTANAVATCIGPQQAEAQALFAELESAGPQMTRALQLEASIGTDSARASGESQQQFAARVIAPAAPPPSPKRLLAETVADIIVARNTVKPATPRGELPPAAAAAVAGFSQTLRGNK